VPYAIARFRVENYDQWKRVRNQNVAKFREAGVKSQLVFRNRNDPNELLVLNEADDFEQVQRLWTGTEEFQAYQQRAGIKDVTAYPFEEQLSI
jgi:hypothetical protein